MSQLQKLLDSKFPITESTSEDGKRLYEVWRDIFTEGYNAAKEEAINTAKYMENSAYPGREGCKWGDTEYDSISTAYGYKIALQDIQATLRGI